ncbi:MAG: A24 family peptidase [Gemmatimonadota bacterium]|nr:A24 family peptidase [Gemmatimonadota bacterium]
MNGLLPVGVGAGVGACVGSFLTVCVARWPEGRSVVSPRSRCLNCKSRLAWWENLPVLGFLLVRGRCRRCGARLGAMYPVVEIAVALIWAGMTSQWGVHPEAVRGSLFLTLLLGIALTDARQYVIPDEFSLGGCVIGLGLAALPGGPSLADAVLGAGLGFGLLWVVAKLGRLVFGKDAMGGGDIKMMAMVGAFLGPAGVLFTLFSGALLGSAIFGPIAFRTARLVPFGIFLAIGAAVAYGWGDPLIAWYLELLGMN